MYHPPSPPLSSTHSCSADSPHLSVTPTSPSSLWTNLVKRRKSATLAANSPGPSPTRRRTLPFITPFLTPNSSPVLSAAEISSEPYSATLDDYALGNLIGVGASALVFTASFIPSNTKVAIKRIDLDRFHQSQIDELRNEVQVMAMCRHPYLLPVLQSFSVANHLYIITPLRTAGAVSHILKSQFPKGLPESAIITIMAQVLLGVSYLHKHGIFHRDIKCGNILIDRQTGLTQLSDFGVSSSLGEGVHRASRRSFVGTVLWMAPEIMEQSSYNSSADIYSLGITCLEMAQGRAPYSQFAPLKAVMLILSNPPPTLNRQNAHYKYSRTLKDLIDSCLFRNPVLRTSADKLIASPLIKKAKKPVSLVKILDLASLPSVEIGHSTIPENDVPATVSRWDFGSPSVVLTSLREIPHHQVSMLRPGPRVRANSAMDIFQLN